MLERETADNAAAQLVVAHTSDLHIGGRFHRDGELETLRAVLDAAGETQAQVLILAGDSFDSQRIASEIIERTAELLASARFDIVILPGNHDPGLEESVYRRREMSDLTNVHVLGVSAGDSVAFEQLDLEVCGVPHMSYADMRPLPVSPIARSMRWQIVVAHGHWVTGPHDAHRAWLMHDDDIAATGADYVALGHWDLPQPAGDGRVPAYYSGSPELARTVNVVRFADGRVDVARHPLRFDG